MLHSLVGKLAEEELCVGTFGLRNEVFGSELLGLKQGFTVES